MTVRAPQSKAILAASCLLASALTGCGRDDRPDGARPQRPPTRAPLGLALTPDSATDGVLLPSPCLREGSPLRAVLVPTTRIRASADGLDALLVSSGVDDAREAGLIRMAPGIAAAKPMSLPVRDQDLALAGPPWVVAGISRGGQSLRLGSEGDGTPRELAQGADLELHAALVRRGDVGLLASERAGERRRAFVLLGSASAPPERWLRLGLSDDMSPTSLDDVRGEEAVVVVQEGHRSSWVRVHGASTETVATLELDGAPLATARRGEHRAALTSTLIASEGSGGVRLFREDGPPVELRSPRPATRAWLRRVGEAWLALWEEDEPKGTLRAAIVAGGHAVGPVVALGIADEVEVASTWDRVAIWLRRGHELIYVNHRCVAEGATP